MVKQRSQKLSTSSVFYKTFLKKQDLLQTWILLLSLILLNKLTVS